MHCIIIGDELWTPCTCKVNTPTANLHSNTQCTEWQIEPDLAAAPTTILQNPEAAVAALIKIIVGGPRAAAAAMIIKTLMPVAVGYTTVKMSNKGTIPGAIMAVMRAQKAGRGGIPI